MKFFELLGATKKGVLLGLGSLGGLGVGSASCIPVKSERTCRRMKLAEHPGPGSELRTVGALEVSAVTQAEWSEIVNPDRLQRMLQRFTGMHAQQCRARHFEAGQPKR